MKSTMLVTGAALLFSATAVLAQQPQIAGVWTLVSTTTAGSDGVKKTGSFGEKPTGRLIVTPDGHYMSINSRSDLPKFKSGSRMDGTPEENKAIVTGSNANFGRYTMSPDGKTMTIKFEGGTWPAWTGTEQKRSIKLAGDSLTIGLTSSYGTQSELVYKRFK